MWENAKKIVENVFYKDKIELYQNKVVVDYIGEEHYQEVLVGEFVCNVQYMPAEIKQAPTGVDIGQTLRVSIDATIPLDYANTYKLKIKEARVDFDDRFWEIRSWTQSLISTVLIASREVYV